MNYNIKDYFTRRERLVFEGKKIKCKLSGNRAAAAIFFRYAKKFCRSQHFELEILLEKNLLLPKNSYNIIISPQKTTRIEYSDLLSAAYAAQTLDQCVFVDQKQLCLNVAHIEDYPSFELRGIIEGFYGNAYGAAQYEDIMKTLVECKMNTFMYAPKDDNFHRKDWREPYCGERLQVLTDCIAQAKAANIDFYYCLSPGLDIRAEDDNEFLALRVKAQQLVDLGVKNFCLLLDDIDYKLSDSAQKKFTSSGEMHAYICNKFNAIIKNLTKNSIIMCPTEYFQKEDSPYRADLKRLLDKEIRIFWTGYNTVAEVISCADGQNAVNYFGHPLVLWDNYPVNDFKKRRLFLGALTNRSIQLCFSHQGMVVNPMEQWFCSKTAVYSAADYMWNCQKYNAKLSFQNAIKYASGKYYKEFAVIAAANSCSVLEQADYWEYKSALQNKQYKKIDRYFKDLAVAAKKLTKAQAQFSAELMPLLDYHILESQIYFEFRQGGIVDSDKLLRLSHNELQGGNYFFVDYIIEQKLLGDIDYAQFKFDTPRENFWKL